MSPAMASSDHLKIDSYPNPEIEPSPELEIDTDTKLAILASLFPHVDQSTLLETLIEAEGEVELASSRLQPQLQSQDLGQHQTHIDQSSNNLNLSNATAPTGKTPTTWTEAPVADFDGPAAKRRKTSQLSEPFNSTTSSSSTQSPLSFASPSIPGQQLSIRHFQTGKDPTSAPRIRPTRKGQTLHLYDADDIASHTPCSIIHNFLPADEANALLRELLDESRTFGRASFQLFERTVTSPHSASFFVDSAEQQRHQRQEYVYNGSYLTDVRRLTPELARVAGPVEQAVNEEIQKRIAQFYPEGKKLKFQCSERWKPNCAFVNCYDGAKENVGMHSDQLTYVGPRAVIGSLSLGVAREFRIKKIVPKEEEEENLGDEGGRTEGAVDSKVLVLSKADEVGRDDGNRVDDNNDKEEAKSLPKAPLIRTLSPTKRNIFDHNHSTDSNSTKLKSSSPKKPSTTTTPSTVTTTPNAADDQQTHGQISIHLPHNSLLVMHAEMQESWKHGIAPAPTVVPHPIAGRKRINVTYRWYRPEFHPRHTPRCRCGVPVVLRCVQRSAVNRGRYMWMCHVNYTPGKEGCGYFKWAEFDGEGRPVVLGKEGGGGEGG